MLRRDVPASVAAARVRAGEWERVRPGAFVSRIPDADRWARSERLALARIAAVEAKLAVPHVLSHQSAALLWGLPSVDDGHVVHVIQQVSSHRGPADLVRHAHHLEQADVVELGGRRVTTLERTVADCLASLPSADGLVLADAALRRGLHRGRTATILTRAPGRRGVRSALEVLSLADDGAESPGESRLRHVLLRVGFPPPETQVLVPTEEGDVWGDLGWRGWRVLAEYDGAAKYTASSAAADAVLRERRREVLIERRGWRVVRASAADSTVRRGCSPH